MIFFPETRKTNIVVQQVEQEFLIYDLSIDKAFCLNETAAAVYHLCDGTRSIAEISDAVSTRLKTLVSEDLIWLALKDLEREGLLIGRQPFPDKFAGMSRREIVKKVGLTSLTAFPLITSVVAPPAATAQSVAICPMSGQCFVAGSPICGGANCAGDYPVTTFQPNTNCMGPATGLATLMCTSSVGMFGVDILIS